MAKVDRNYEFYLKADISKYLGEWIAICNQKIVAHGKDFKKVFNEARQFSQTPFVTKVHDKHTMIF